MHVFLHMGIVLFLPGLLEAARGLRVTPYRLLFPFEP